MSAKAHAATLLDADEERVQRLERDLDQARRDLEQSRLLAAECGAVVAAESGLAAESTPMTESERQLRQEESDRRARASRIAEMRQSSEDRKRKLARVIGPPPTESEALGRAVEDGDLEY